jgi:hypothetical protein
VAAKERKFTALMSQNIFNYTLILIIETEKKKREQEEE